MKNIIPVTDLQRQAAQILTELNDSSEPFVITQRGRATAVLLTAKRYAEIEEDLQRLDELELLAMVEDSRRAIKEGKTISQKDVKKRLGIKNG
jgi:prevent-host-death family protein